MLKTPDLTPAQLTAVVGWAAAQAVAYGWIDQGQAQLVVSLGATVLALAWQFADAHIRHGRATGAKAPVAVPPAFQVTGTQTSSSTTPVAPVTIAVTPRPIRPKPAAKRKPATKPPPK